MCAALLAGCSANETKTTWEKVKSDMSGYSTLTDEEHVFYDLTVKDMAEMMDEGETFVVYFGFDHCAWCLEAVPLLNEAAKEAEMTVGYINTRADEEWQSNLDIDDYDLVVEKLGDYLSYDNDGVKHLYTPFVCFIKDGSVVYTHEGTIPDHNAKEETLTDEEKEEVKGYYEHGFGEIK